MSNVHEYKTITIIRTVGLTGVTFRTCDCVLEVMATPVSLQLLVGNSGIPSFAISCPSVVLKK